MTRLKVIAPSGKPDPPLSSLSATQAAAKAVFPAKAGIHSGNPVGILDTGFRRCDEVLYGIWGDCPIARLTF